jgi:hypothetical protein
MPTDLRVERELFETLDQHHLAQRSYLDRQLEDIEPHFHRSLAEVAPERLYRASSAMNVALAEEAASIIGFLPNERIRSSPHYQLGRELRDILRSELEEGCPGDRKITNTWATNLGLAGWYQWRAR